MVRGEDAFQIHAGEHIAIEDHDRVIAQLVVDVADAAAGAERGLFHHVLDLQAQIGAITEILLKDLGLIGGRHDDVLDAGGLDAGEQVLQERVVCRRQHRLRRTDG